MRKRVRSSISAFLFGLVAPHLLCLLRGACRPRRPIPYQVRHPLRRRRWHRLSQRSRCSCHTRRVSQRIPSCTTAMGTGRSTTLSLSRSIPHDRLRRPHHPLPPFQRISAHRRITNNVPYYPNTSHYRETIIVVPRSFPLIEHT